MDVNRFFAVFHCRSLRGHTFCVNRKYAKNHKRGGDCVFPAPFETPPLNRPRETIAMVSLGFLPRMANLRLTSAVFVPSYFSQKSLPVMLNTAPTPGGSRRGIAIPLLSLRVRVHRERGSRNTLSLCDSLVTFCSHRKSPCGAYRSWLLRKAISKTPQRPFASPLPQPNITKLRKICYLRLIVNRRVWLHNSYK